MIIFYIAKVQVDSKQTKVSFLAKNENRRGIHFTEDKNDPNIQYFSSQKKAVLMARTLGYEHCILQKWFEPAD